MKKLLILSLFLTCTLSVLTAQDLPAGEGTLDSQQNTAYTQMTSPETQNDYAIENKPSKNLIKVNLTSLALKNFSLQYERVLSKSISAAVSFSLMTERTIPSVNLLVKGVNMFAGELDAESEDIIRNVLISSYSVTPEVRFYLGKKGYGTGFYTALFYRYGHYEVSNIAIPYTNDLEEDITINTGGTITSHTGGFLMGYQWALGKHMCLDWQMFGPHYGVSSGDFRGVPSSPFSAQDQTDIEGEFMKIDSPLLEQSVDATADEVKMLFNGPWGGIRFALSIGVKF
jgi:hypothetical protein